MTTTTERQEFVCVNCGEEDATEGAFCQPCLDNMSPSRRKLAEEFNKRVNLITSSIPLKDHLELLAIVASGTTEEETVH